MPVLPDRSAIAARLFADETTTVRALAAEAMLNADEQRRVAELARQLVAAVRAGGRSRAASTPSCRSIRCPLKRAWC